MPTLSRFAMILAMILAISFAVLSPGTAIAETGKLEKKWKVTSIGEHTGKLLGFIEFEDGFLKGQSTCNGYSATYDLGENQTITIHRVAVTQLICKIGNKMELEKQYIKGLEAAKTYKIENDELIIYKQDQSLLARFK